MTTRRRPHSYALVAGAVALAGAVPRGLAHSFDHATGLHRPWVDNFLHTGIYAERRRGNATASTKGGDTDYVNHFPTEDNAYGIDVPSSLEDSFIFLIGDHGLPVTSSYTGPCCQTEVADLMKSKRAELEGEGKSLLFVGAVGDNFYWTGLNSAADDGGDQLARWNNVYAGTSDVPWLAAMGNHDVGNADLYATCPWYAPDPVYIDGQAYASNQLDADKGGLRENDASQNYHMPDFNFRYTIDELNLEVYSLDQNYRDVGGLGGDSSGRTQVESVCGGMNALTDRVYNVGYAGEDMLTGYAAAGAADPSRTRNVLVLQHYPDTCDYLQGLFEGAMPAGETLNFRCAFGHVHSTQCEETGSDGSCVEAMVGGGGGCCSNSDPAAIGLGGFGLVTFDSDGGMAIAIENLGASCSIYPSY